MTKKTVHDEIIEILLIVYFFIGMMNYPILKYLRYSISLIVQLRIVWKIGLKRFFSKECALPLISYTLVLLIGLVFLVIRVPTMEGINRVLPFFSIFGLTLLVAYKDKICFETIFRYTIFLYKCLAVIIILDALIFRLTGAAIWKPIIYLSYRYAGPFYDCNYMGMLYAFLLLAFWFNPFQKKRQITTILLFIVTLWLSGSWSAIIISIGLLVLKEIFIIEHLFLKQIIILCLYFGAAFWIYNNEDLSLNVFVDILGKILPISDESIAIKFGSLLIRIETQIDAIKLFTKNIFGYGPRTILEFFEHDTHNSYVAILFETGIFGFMLLLINMSWKKKSKLLDSASSFVILSAMVLDIHYTIIYSLFLFFISMYDDNAIRLSNSIKSTNQEVMNVN